MYVGDEIMKKTIIWVLFALLSGALLGKITFDRYEKIDTKNVISYNNYVYMLKYGSYKTVDDMTSNITNPIINPFLFFIFSPYINLILFFAI